MPELPEVETICRGVKILVGKKIHKIFRSEKKLRIASTLDLSLLTNKAINKVSRRARYLIFDFSDGYSLILHLGMTGSIVFRSSLTNLIIAKHDHFACQFSDKTHLIFNDPRRFGFVDLIRTKDLAEYKMLAKLGPEPLLDDFNQEYLAQKLRDKKTNIKTTMMDNEIVVGVGNIYISESLFEAKISPLRNSYSLTKSEIFKLTKAIKNVLQKAIELGGSSISDYVNSEGKKGDFQNSFKVYGNNGKKCLHCNYIVTKIIQNGRSSFYCANCQK